MQHRLTTSLLRNPSGCDFWSGYGNTATLEPGYARALPAVSSTSALACFCSLSRLLAGSLLLLLAGGGTPRGGGAGLLDLLPPAAQRLELARSIRRRANWKPGARWFDGYSEVRRGGAPA